MNILIIGAGGFIGSHLSECILRNHRNWKIFALDVVADKINHLLADENFDFSKVDILASMSFVEKKLAQSDVVLPLAAIANPSTYVQNPLAVFKLDFEANLAIVKLAVKHRKRIIFPSTSEVYGMCPDDEFDEEMSNCVTGPIQKQRWIYSASKQLLDRVIYAHGIRDNLSYTLFRPFNFIGPRLDDIFNASYGSSRVITQFLSNIYHKKDINLVDGGNQMRCFIDIADGIDAIERMIENRDGCAEQRIFNVGNPSNLFSIKELAHKVVDMAKAYKKLADFAARVVIHSVDSREYYGSSYQDISRRVPAIQKAQKLLGWTPKIGLEESLTKIMDFYFG
ncbi:MAG: bifunctional UDP-4-keto-pentose/UDP-xylose synthase [Holosporaceae bacterium]|jgi:nucleoside-diphosphate-sugar epimerase|nr:bifunctional UDP-4-keto-pentose/UDP-xylose synthase [Holosporaceae bacterium]